MNSYLFSTLVLLAFIFIINAASTSSAPKDGFVIPYRFPWLTQCNSTWGQILMGDKTICEVGCLMSSTAMAIAGSNIIITQKDGSKVTSDPQTLNTWLQQNDGYSNNE